MQEAPEAPEAPEAIVWPSPAQPGKRPSHDTKGRAMFSGFKTYITAAVAVVTAAAAYLTGEASLVDTLQLVFAALMGAFIRSGVKADTGQ